MRKNIFAIFVLAMMLVLCVSAVASARASYYLESYSSTIKAEGSRKVLVAFEVAGTGKMTSIGAKQVEIQEKVGTSWVPYTTFKSSDYSGFLRSNSNIHASEVRFTGVVGTQYRAIISFYAADNTGSDTKTQTSSTVTCK